MTHSLRALIPALAFLAGCAAPPIPTLHSDPAMYSVTETTASLRSGQRVALVNAYAVETKYLLRDSSMNVDLRELTGTTIAMMSRHLARNGISIDPGADKKVTLKVREPSTTYMYNPFYQRWRTALSIEAAFADGTITLVSGENVAPRLQRSMDGAVLRGVTLLFNDARLVSYVNK